MSVKPLARAREAAVTGPPVLVVDHDPYFRRLIRWTLQAEGMPVEAVPDGWQALLAGSREQPAAVILDITVSGIHSLDLVAVLRAIHGRDLPIIAIGGDDWARDRLRHLRAQAHLQKPFEIDDLLTAPRSAIAGETGDG